VSETQVGSAAVSQYFLYVDESGDPGQNKSITTHFVLAGLLIEAGSWLSYLKRIKSFRKTLRCDYGLRLADELHAGDIWVAGGDFRRLRLSYKQRRHLFTEIAFFLRGSSEIKIIVVSIHKSQFQARRINIKLYAWKLFIQRFENFLLAEGAHGIVIPDEGSEKVIRDQLRKMRLYNPIRSKFGDYYRQEIVRILEDPFFRRSKESYFVQMADSISYLCRLRDNATARQRKWGLHKVFKIMKPRYLLQANTTDRYGFVYAQ